MNLRDILEAREALSVLFTTKFPGSKVLKIKKFIDACEKELTTFTSIRDEKMKELGIKPNEEVETDKWKKFESYINEVTSSEIDVKPDFEIIESEIDSLSLSAKDLTYLQNLKIIKL